MPYKSDLTRYRESRKQYIVETSSRCRQVPGVRPKAQSGTLIMDPSSTPISTLSQLWNVF